MMRKRKIIEEGEGKKGHREMPQTWAAIKRSLMCEPKREDVYNPVVVLRHNSNHTIRGGNGSNNKRKEKVISRSSRSGKLIDQDVRRRSNSSFENQITSFGDNDDDRYRYRDREGFAWSHSGSSGSRSYGPMRFGSGSGVQSQLEEGDRSDYSTLIYYKEADAYRSFKVASCLNCGGEFTKLQTAEAHHLLHHSVSEVERGGNSWEIINEIVRSKTGKNTIPLHVLRILKVNHLLTTLAHFEEHRELVKIRANRFSNLHPRCLADGNELMRFHATTVSCSLTQDQDNSSLCMSDQCCLCCIIRDGFKTTNIPKSNSLLGVFTASTTDKALITIQDETDHKALIICRVIAGRVHKPTEGDVGFSGYDSIGLGFNIEHLYSQSPTAILPCFVVLCES